MLKHRISRLNAAFDADHAIYWSHLSRLNNLMVIVNISMFFLTGLVAKGYYYTFYSPACAGVVGGGRSYRQPLFGGCGIIGYF